MKSWDAIIVGAGIIGLSLAIELHKQGLRVLVVEKGEPGREASWAAGGMLVDFPPETKPGLRELATASARMYPEFVHELQDESGLKIDLRSAGNTVLSVIPTYFPCESPARGPLISFSCPHQALLGRSPKGSQHCGRHMNPRHISQQCIWANVASIRAM